MICEATSVSIVPEVSLKTVVEKLFLKFSDHLMDAFDFTGKLNSDDKKQLKFLVTT